MLDCQFAYHKQLAEEYIDINLLTNQNVQVNLVNGVLDKWIITFQSEGKKVQFIKLVDSNSSELKAKLCSTVNIPESYLYTFIHNKILTKLDYVGHL